MRHGSNGGPLLAAVVALMLAIPGGAVAQAREDEMSERAAAAALADNRLTPERDRALKLARELGAQATSELRTAVIKAAWAEWRGEMDRPEGSEAIFDYMDAVAGLQDPRAIPFLIEVLPNGGENALADLGLAAFPAVLAAVSDPGGYSYRVANGVTVLRFMLEDGSLNGRQLEQVRAVARDRLSGTEHRSVVAASVRLALALGDPELRVIVERIATDRTAAEALVSPYLPSGTLSSPAHHDRAIASVQEDARLFLSGGGADIGPIRRRGASPP